MAGFYQVYKINRYIYNYDNWKYLQEVYDVNVDSLAENAPGMATPFFAPVSVSVYFDAADRDFCEALDRFLAPLKQNGRMRMWDARQIGAGQEWKGEYDQHLATDSVLILLVSPHFLDSEVCQQQMSLALSRYQDGSAVVVPVLVRPCLWRETELHSLQILPRKHDALSLETYPEAVWQEIVAEINQVIDSVQQRAFVIYVPEDRDVVERLQQDMASSSVALWSLDADDFASNLSHRARNAMRQASSVVLIASAATRSSRAINAQMGLAADYHRRVLVFWAKGEDGDRPRPEQWQAEMVCDARGERYEEACKMLVERLKQREVEGLDVLKHFALIGEPRNPYKGLHAFTADDRRDFFGRERFVDGLISRLEQVFGPEQYGKQQDRLLAVVGASGAGKSSVVLAGLLPRLQNGAIGGSQGWIYLDPIVPGTHPLEALAVSLAQQPSLGDAVALHNTLKSDSLRALHLLTRQLVGFTGRKVVLFIDQFEEVLTLTTEEEERGHFFDLLIEAVHEPRGPLLVLLTLRADFYEHLMMHYPTFFRLLDAQRVPVLPMEREDLRRVIEGPADLPDVQVSFEENLVGDLLFDMREQVGALPLLQFTLDQLFVHRSGHRLTRQAYDEIGGVKGALTRHAEATYAALPSDTHRLLTRTLFLRLIDPGITEQDTTRRRAMFAEFELPDAKQSSVLRETIDAFIKARLLTANEYTGTTTLEVSHEALIREWPRLIDWLREAREDIRLQQTISKDAAEWELNKRSRDHLYQGSKLREAEKWAKRNTLSQHEADFLRAGARQRVQFVMNTALVVLLILSISGVAGWSYLHRQPDPTLVTNLQDGGVGSLRWAVATAKSGSIITFDQSLWGMTIALNDYLFITKDLSIRGPETGKLTISNKAYYIQVDAGKSLNISDLTFSGGKVNHSPLLINHGTLDLANSIVSGNRFFYTNSGLAGGGIYNNGTLKLTNSIVSGNAAVGNDGGGIYNVGGTLTLTNSTIFGNTAYSGGGIYNVEGTLNLTNSTIFGNTAFSGGGIFSEDGTAAITFSTFYGNTAQWGGGISVEQNLDYPRPNRLTMRNSLMAGNHTPPSYLSFSNGPDIIGELVSGGYNLIQNTAGITFLDPNHEHYTDIMGTSLADLHIDAELGWHGGATPTLALQSGSPAIDAVPLGVCRVGGITTDQRGVRRPQGRACDIGAYEYEG